MKTICILVFLATIYVSANAFVYEYKDNSFNLRDDGDPPITPPPTEINKNCTKSGLMCKNCKELVTCVKIDGEWHQYPAKNCDDTKEKPEYCLIDQCSSDPNPECPPGGGSTYKFECQNTGLFPDPYNCQIYHGCVMGNEVIPPQEKAKYTAAKCLGDTYGYNPITTYCDKKLTNKVCPTTPPVPVCKKLGQSGGISGTSIFYMCVDSKGDLVPSLLMCPHGTRYVDGNCK